MDDRRLARALVARKGKFGLFIMDAGDTEISAQTVMDIAKRVLDENTLSHRHLHLNTEVTVDDLITSLHDLKKYGCDALHLTGMQEWLKVREPFNNSTATRADILNIQRENIFKSPVIVLAWLSPQGIGELSGLLDLWSWRQGIYNLQDKDTSPAPRPPRL